MIVQNKLEKRGFSVNLFKDASIEYQEDVWENIPDEIKKIIMGNLVYLKISPYSMFLEKMHFDFPKPYLSKLGDKGVIGDMPRVAYEDKVSTKELIDKFKNKNIGFGEGSSGLMDGIETKEVPLIGMSFGKDSLLSYGVAKELGLSPELVMVQDFWDKEADYKFDIIDRFEDDFDEEIYIVYDSLDDVSAYEGINKSGSEGIVGANAINSYITMLLPLVVKHGVNTLVFGNEQNFNDYFVNPEGFKVYPSYEQSSEWMVEQNKALGEFTNGGVKVNSFVEPLYNIAEVKVLFNRYPSIARYQMSCDLSHSKGGSEKWCYNCPMCGKAFLYLKACGIDPRIIGFNKNFFDKEFSEFYPLFTKPTRIYEKPPAVRDEQLFAFYLVFKKGYSGYLIDSFKERFLEEAKSREDELFNRFFKVHDALSMGGKMKGNINSIYKEELVK